LPSAVQVREDDMSENEAILQRLDGLTAAVQSFARLAGARLTRVEVCDRLGVHRNTLRSYIMDRDFPTPGRDGKWLLAEVLEWEARK
jgi:predicted DNA-binding transcriptional regulator AlpA